MIKKGMLVKVNPDRCFTRWSKFAIRHPKYMLRWSYSNFPQEDRIYKVIGIHGKGINSTVVVRDTNCKAEKCNPIFFMERCGVKQIEEVSQ